jgi:tRNA(Ile)-lysidine synthase
VDHGLRPEAERGAERELVTSQASRLGVALEIVEIGPGLVAGRAAKLGCGIEAAARWYRRRSLLARASEFGCERIYLGHNADDSLESSLMGMLGGAGSAGLRGILPVAGPFVRPLSGLRKDEILRYLEELHLPYSLDSTNRDLSIRRNRIRSLLVPLLDAEFQGWRSGLHTAAKKAAMDEEALGECALALLFSPGEGGGLEISRASFDAAPVGLRLRSLIDAYSRMDGLRDPMERFSGGRVSSRLALEALEALGRGKSHVARGLRLGYEGERLRLLPTLDFEGRDGYFVAIGEKDVGRVVALSAELRVTLRWENGRGPTGLLEGSFDFPIVVRSRRPGDTIALPSGMKSVDELLSEWRVPLVSRGRLPLVQDRRGLVAVLGSGFPGGKNRFRHGELPPSATRCLSIAVKGA